MVYTVTLNPSLDYIVSVKDFEPGMTNRTESESILPGGKGINVSIVLTNLGISNTALGYIAGFTGTEIEHRLEAYGINTRFIKLDQGMSRINIKLNSIEGTEINGSGPDIPSHQLEQLMMELDNLQADDMLVLAGSIPASIPNDIYKQMMSRLSHKGIQIIVDATGALLLNVLPDHPFLIKPNHHELGELFDVKLSTKEEVIPYARKLQEQGARNVLVSMAGQGAVLVAENGTCFMADAPSGTVKNAVGAGDSMVAGFISGWTQTGQYETAFKMGLAAGSASAFSEALATEAEIQQLFKNIHPI